MTPQSPEHIASIRTGDEERYGFGDSMAELQWLLLILVMLYFHIPTRPIDNPDRLVAVMVVFAGFVLLFRFCRSFCREARWKLVVQTLAMTAFITLVLWYTGRSQSPLLNLYLLVIIACAITLGRMTTLLEVLLIGACYLLLGYADYGISILSPETFTTLMANFSPFLLVAYVTSLLAEDIHEARRRIVVLSQTDELTGLMNMRAFSTLLDREITTARRYLQPFTLMMIDVDRLKKVNDRFGHVAGTQLLRAVAAAISDCVRSADVLARYGGDEFVILMPHTRSEAARIAAERIRSAIHGSSFNMNDWRITASVSIGIAAFPESTGAPEDVLEKADVALYQSKQAGRDRVTVYRHDADAGPLRPDAARAANARPLRSYPAVF
jgi:diguanylate cyclase (GGDEF)-like protein